MHTDATTPGGSEAIVASAQARGVPVVSGRQMLQWLDGRNASSFQALTWDGTALSFTVVPGPGANGLQALVPVPAGLSVASLRRDGLPVSYTLESLKGMEYTAFAAQSGSYEVVFGADVAAPTVLLVSPLADSVDVPTGTEVVVLFSEPMDPASVTATSFELRSSGGSLVAASVGYDPGSNRATLAPSSPLAPDTTYTARLLGGSSGMSDLAGNPLAADFVWSFATVTAPGESSYTIWPDTATPAILSDSDTSAVELGVKFQSSVDGFLTALRFYKAPANTGTHAGNLWTSSGTLLATVTFANETASGWQTQALPAPVPIAAGTTYVASYHTNVGRYSATLNYFASGVDSGPLRALANGEDGPNGVYRYGASSAFPDQTWNAANYWVDVVFSP